MSDRSRDEARIADERIKTLSAVFANLAAGLTAAVAARIYVNGDLDLAAIIWTFGAIALISIALKILVLLGPED